MREIKRLDPASRVTLALVPCPYASGAEVAVAREIPGVDRVLSPWQTTRAVLLGGQPRAARGVCAFLGGEPWHALVLGQRLGYPSVAYLVRRAWLDRLFRATGVRDARVPLPPGGRVVGDLMVDAADRSPETTIELEAGSGPVVGLFPGSRTMHLRAALGVFLETVERLRAARPGTRFLLVLSPFVDRGRLQAALDQPWSLGLPRRAARLVGNRLQVDGGGPVSVSWGRPYEAFRHLDLALSIPGTNTAELACASIPMVIALHTSAPVMGGGLAGFLERLPIGDWLKVQLRKRKHRRVGLTALPNIQAGKELAPEIMVDPNLANLQACLLRLLDDEQARRSTARALREAMGPGGAARRMAELILENGAKR